MSAKDLTTIVRLHAQRCDLIDQAYTSVWRQATLERDLSLALKAGKQHERLLDMATDKMRKSAHRFY